LQLRPPPSNDDPRPLQRTPSPRIQDDLRPKSQERIIKPFAKPSEPHEHHSREQCSTRNTSTTLGEGREPLLLARARLQQNEVLVQYSMNRIPVWAGIP
jgi:hypothetical protein